MKYSFFDKIIYKFFLNNNIFQEVLFDVDKFFFKKEKKIMSLMICGLPRSGTTALLNQLYKTKKFSSLTYEDLPFLLSPNLYLFLKKNISLILFIKFWKKIFFLNNKKKLQKRIHNDGIFINDKMPDAFDEVFWRVFLDRKYIKKKLLRKHNINSYQINEYLTYISLVANKEKKNFYITKNNNNLLRLKSLQKLKDTKIIITFRNPIFHSFSLMKTHKLISKLQDENKFILTYMDSLVHHEFGLNIKKIYLNKKFISKYSVENINYWLEYWIYVYKYVLENFKTSKNLQFLAYEKFNLNIKKILINFNIQINKKILFKNNNNYHFVKNIQCCPIIKNKALKIYAKLNKM